MVNYFIERDSFFVTQVTHAQNTAPYHLTVQVSPHFTS